MQNVTYSLRDQRKENEGESLFQQLQLTLDSLGNNLMAMLWLAELALKALREEDNLDQAKRNLDYVLQAGECAKKLMRTVLNSQKINHIESQWFQARLI
jgi:hypothetical protein